MLPIMDGYQLIFLQHLPPQWTSLGMPAVVTLVLLVLGFVFFMRRVGEMVDEL
jgi:ABC-type polysaccharide/polyol phosphate export permease